MGPAPPADPAPPGKCPSRPATRREQSSAVIVSREHLAGRPPPAYTPAWSLTRRRSPMSAPCRTAAVLAFVLFAPSVRGQAPQKPEERKPGDEMIEKYLAAKAAELGKRVLDGATTLAEWQQKRPRLKE